MRDVFPEEAVQEHPAAESPGRDTDAARIRESIEGQVACPFCGVVSDGSQAVCAKCTMENTPVSRKATKHRIGPWYVLQNRNPAAPGMKWETLLAFVQKGRVRPNSVVRGPTTHQLWRFAAHVKGLSREFGVCYSCGGSVERIGNVCPHCNRLQEAPTNPDTLLETDETEARLPIFKEISPAEAEQHDHHQSALMDDSASEAAEEAQRKIREQEESLARQQREALERDRQAVEHEKQAAAHERDLARLEQEAVARDREALARAKELLEKDRSTLANEREAARREREAATAAAREATGARDVAIREAATARELAARDAAAARETAARELASARETAAREAAAREAASREAAAHPAPVAAASKLPPHEATPSEPAVSVWDLGEHDTHKSQFSPTQGNRPSAFASPASQPAGSVGGQKPRAREGFLSAKDLAAAFKLNAAVEEYDIAAKPAEAHRKPDPIPQPAFPIDIAPPPPRRGGIGKIVVTLAILATVAAAALIPELRDKVGDYWNDITDQHPKPAVPAHAGPPKPPAMEVPDFPPDYHPEAPVIPATTLPSTRPVPTPVPAPTPAPQVTPPVTPPAPVTPPVVPPPATAPASIPEVTPAPATRPATTLPAAIIPPAPAADPATQAKILFRSAIDAEVRGDFSAAVGFLQQIEKLPHEAWPPDVELRLQLDKAQLNQK